jgi:putative secretion ATPase (PEP-CTERM system associated)
MYESYYGLTGKPFQLNPDPLFYFGSKQHQRAKAYLEYGLHQSEGFIVISGEVGAGKTTLLRGLLGQLNANEVIAANVVSTQLGADDILRMVAAQFGAQGAENAGTGKAGLLLALEACLKEHRRAGRRCLLIIDEAQHLSFEALEELRMLSNFQSGNQALLQSFLVGQPEFREIIFSPRMQQLRQRIIASCHIGPMDASETRGYIDHRLKCAGSTGLPVFSDDAYAWVYKASGGVPRRINLICDRLLLSGFLGEKKEFNGQDVAEVADELFSETLPARPGESMPAEPARPAVAPLSAEAARAVVAPAAQAPAEGVPEGTAAQAEPALAEAAQPSSLGENVEQRLDRLESLVLRVEASHNETMELLRSIAASGMGGKARGGK